MLKDTLARALPRSWVHFLKKLYFPSVLKNVTEDDWPYARIVRLLIDRGDRVADIGANIGYVSSLLSRYVGEEGRVFSFEPVPETYDLLSHSLRKLGISNVETFRIGLSSSDGEATMEIPLFPQGGENFYQSHIIDEPDADDNLRAVDVKLRRLDDVLEQEKNRIAFMKIDVEGHEFDVLDGGQELLRASRPALLVECSGGPDEEGSHAYNVFRLLEGCDFEAYVLDDAAIRRRRDKERAVDYFFLMPGHVARLQSHGVVQD